MIKVEFETKEQWLEARKLCLTGTTVGKAIGIQSPYTPKTLEQMAKDPAVNFGINCENAIITIFKNLPEISKKTLIIPTIKPTLWYADRDKRIAGSFDALAFEGSQSGFCEVKSTSAGLYNLKNMIIPATTWTQIIHYFTLDKTLQFCYLIVCDYPKWGNGSVKIDWIKILRSDLTKSILNLKGWQQFLLMKGEL